MTADPARALFATPAMADAFSGAAHVRAMLAFEAALARAEARAGVIPPTAADAIASACDVSRFDVQRLYQEAIPAGTPAIPLVRLLTALVPAEHLGYVHWGATSQDTIDTALMLQARAGLTLLLADLRAIGARCAALAEEHRQTLMAGRTLLQQALPITFGLKAARWLALVTRQSRRLAELRAGLAVQLGGAAGTLASLGEAGPSVVVLLAEELGLSAPDLPWHAERDRVAELAAQLGVVAGAMATIATDLVLLAQSEVAEVSEDTAAGKGGSSALPHKRNPVDATFALAAARLAVGQVPVVLAAMAQEHERAAGGWQAEWQALPDLFNATASAVDRVRAALSGLEIDAARMRANLDAGQGLPLAESLATALAAHVGRSEAFALVKAASDRVRHAGIPLLAAARDDPRITTLLSDGELTRALDPAGYLGSSDTFIDRALAGWRELEPAKPGR